jgi:hypothetical protein
MFQARRYSNIGEDRQKVGCCQRVIPITDYAELSLATIGYAGMLSSLNTSPNRIHPQNTKLLLSLSVRSEPRLDTRETSIVLKPHG